MEIDEYLVPGYANRETHFSAGNKGKTWADRFMASLVASVPKTTYIASLPGALLHIHKARKMQLLYVVVRCPYLSVYSRLINGAKNLGGTGKPFFCRFSLVSVVGY